MKVVIDATRQKCDALPEGYLNSSIAHPMQQFRGTLSWWG